MEENTSASHSTKACDFSFYQVLKAGFFAAILTNLLMVFQGYDALFYFGTLFLGQEADSKIIYTVGVGVASILGIIFTLLYALVIAPMRFMHNLVQAIIFAALLTAISYYGSPSLPQIADKITHYFQSTKNEAALNNKSTAVTVQDASSEIKEATAIAEKAAQIKTQRALVMTFSNSLIFALIVVVLYRRNYCQ